MDDNPVSPNWPVSWRPALTGPGAAGATDSRAVQGPRIAAVTSERTRESRTAAADQPLLDRFFAAKSAHSPDQTMAFFDQASTTYIDATLGLTLLSWPALKALFDQSMPTWPPAARSYSTKIVGGEHGMAVFFTNTPEEFGHEIRGIAIVDIRGGKFARWIDYWDGRHFGVAAAASLQVPRSRFPADFGESRVGERVPVPLKQTVATLSGSMAQGDAQAAAELFAEDGILEDLTLHTKIVGRRSIASYLGRAVTALPYGQGVRVRHVVGGALGGGYEWTNDSGPVPRGVNTAELNMSGQIVRVSSIWDGSLADRGWLTSRMAEAIEQ